MSARKRLTREESKAKTRQELLRAASRLFLRNGYVQTSLANIAEEAALTKGAVYSNFESKEDLFLALLQEPDPEWTGPHDIRELEGDTPEDKARTFGNYAATQIPSRRHLALFLEMNAVALRSDRARQWVAAHNDAFFDDLGQRLQRELDLTRAFTKPTTKTCSAPPTRCWRPSRLRPSRAAIPLVSGFHAHAERGTG